MKRSIEVDGWTIQLRVRVQRKKKRDRKGRTRGRYEEKYAYVNDRAPNGGKRTWYLGSGGKLSRSMLVEQTVGEENFQSSENSSAAARQNSRGRKCGEERARNERLDTRDPYDTRTRSLFPSEKERWARGSIGFGKRR